MATKIVTKNSSTAGSAPSASDLVQGELAVNVVDKRLYTEDNAGNIVELGTNPLGEITANGGIALGDNDKATFGAGDDLQIYHDGSNSYIANVGSGSLIIQDTDGTGDIYIKPKSGQTAIAAYNDNTVEIAHSGNVKLTTTSTGIDVTGTATMDGLTLADGGDRTITGPTNNDLIINSRGNTPGEGTRIQSSGSDRLVVDDTTGDISFYEDTGTTPKLFWDASAESLGIGTSSPAQKLHITGSAPFARLESTSTSYNGFTTKNDSGNFYFGIDDSSGNFYGSAYARAIYADGAYPVTFYTNAAERMRIAASGKVGIGTDSPLQALHVNSGTGNSAAIFESTDSTSQIWLKDSASSTTYQTGLGCLGDNLLFNNGGERMRIDSSGSVGIGTSSPDTLVQATNTSASTNYISYEIGSSGINSANKGGFAIYELGSLATSITYARDNTGHTDFNADILVFNNAANTSERMRIDASGNVLVGTTDANPYNNSAGSAADNGFAFGSGALQVARYNDAPLLLNRTGTNDGDIQTFWKSGVKVGSIGTDASRFKIKSNSLALYLENESNAKLVWGRVSGVDYLYPNAAANLGYPTEKFQHLYLSGGVYLGGTGAANKLDDYESGTWTPNLLSGTSITYTTTPTGSYTKIGKIVHISASIDVSNSNTADGSGLTIGGLPFSAVGDAMTFTLGRYRSFLAPKDSAVLGAVATSTYIQFFESNNNYILYSEIGSSGVLTFSGTYEAA